MKSKYYVTMTDSFLSGWGRAEGKIAKFVMVCDSYEEAKHVAEYARSRSDQKYVRIANNCPRYDSRHYLVQFRNREDSPIWYE